jgi:protein SCO1/2
LNRGLVLSLALLALAAAVGTAAAESPGLKSGVFKPPRPAPQFSLRGSDGPALALSRYRGKVVALGFGYTFCPDVCPTTLADLAQVRGKLGPAGKDFQVIYVTVDPERDTAQRLQKYLAAFDPTFIGATGTPDELAHVRESYGIVVSKKIFSGARPGYLIHHSSPVWLIDGAGNLRAMAPFGTPVEDLAHDVEVLLGEIKR